MSATLNQCDEFCMLEDLKRFYTPELFTHYTWLTPNQHRDMCSMRGPVDTALIKQLKRLAMDEQARRKTLPNEFVECPRCRGYHGELNNNDNLCERCEHTVHIIYWDREHLTSAATVL